MGFRQIWTVNITMHDVPSCVSCVEKGASLPSPPAAALPKNDSYDGHVDRVYEPCNNGGRRNRPQRGHLNHGGNNNSSGNNHALHKIPVYMVYEYGVLYTQFSRVFYAVMVPVRFAIRQATSPLTSCLLLVRILNMGD